MFPSRSHTNTQPEDPNPLTASATLEDPAACKTRHLAMCRELAELGMAMARHTAQRALAIPPEPPEPDAPEAAAPKAPDHLALAFARLSRSVRQSIELEQRILNPAPARARTHTPPTPPPPDPRRAPVKAASSSPWKTTRTAPN